MKPITFTYPNFTIKCKKGDFIIQTVNNCYWKVYLVEDIVLLSRLVPLSLDKSDELIEEVHLLDSEKPARMGKIYLLLTSFVEKFESIKDAKKAIEDQKLVQGVRWLCASIEKFPKKSSQVYKK
jgi:hypothetical protein